MSQAVVLLVFLLLCGFVLLFFVLFNYETCLVHCSHVLAVFSIIITESWFIFFSCVSLFIFVCVILPFVSLPIGVVGGLRLVIPMDFSFCA